MRKYLVNDLYISHIKLIFLVPFVQAYLAFYVIDELQMAQSAKALVGTYHFSAFEF